MQFQIVKEKQLLDLGMTHGKLLKYCFTICNARNYFSFFSSSFKALGETMIVVMAAGLRPNLSWNPLKIWQQLLHYCKFIVGDFEFNSPETLSAFALGLVLFYCNINLNMISLSLIRKFKEKYKVNTLWLKKKKK